MPGVSSLPATRLGGRCVASDPNAHEFELVYEPKVKIAAAGAVVGGGCG